MFRKIIIANLDVLHTQQKMKISNGNARVAFPISNGIHPQGQCAIIIKKIELCF